MPAKHNPEAPYSGKFVVRINPELHEKLADLATSQKRSLNAQVEWMLEDGLKRAGKKRE